MKGTSAMKNIKKTLVLLLAAALLFAIVPPSAVSAAVNVGYTVLAEYSWNGDFVGSAAYSQNIVHSTAAISIEGKNVLIKYDDGGFSTIAVDASSIELFNGNLYVGYTGAGAGLIDFSGKQVIPPIYDEITMIGDNSKDELLLGRWNGLNEFYLYNAKNGDIVPLSDDVYWLIYYNGRNDFDKYLVDNEGEYNFVDLTGNAVYDSIEFVQDGYFIFTDKRGYGVVTTRGEELLDSFSNRLYYAGDGYFYEEGNSTFLYGVDTYEISPKLPDYSNHPVFSKYGNATSDSKGIYWIVEDENNKVGVVDGTNNVVVPFGIYDNIYFLEGDLLWAVNRGRNGENSKISILRPYGGNAPGEYIYDVADPGEGVADLVEGLADNVTTPQEAVEAVQRLTAQMTPAQKDSATGADLATLLAETAAAKASTQPVTGNEIIISAANVAPVISRAASAVDAVENALISGGITTDRYIDNTIILMTAETGMLTIRIDPDILTTEVDKVRIETPNYALTFKISDLAESLTRILTFTATSETAGAAGASVARGALSSRIYYAPVTSGGYAPIASVNRKAVTVTMPDGIRGVPVTLSFDSTKDASAGQAIKSTMGTVATSKYNPATGTLDGKVNESGTYTTYDSQKNFTDISNKSQEMQTAINYLASKGVINGTTETTFSPDKTIPRSDIAALLVRAIGKLDNRAAAQFNDVKPSDWYYTTAASSQKCGLFKGDDHNMFRGPSAIVRYDSVVVAARVLMLEMNYKTPGNTSQYLSRYKDTVPGWAQSEVALATKENLIVYRVDGTFSGEKAITRGDAAILIYRLFQKIW